MPCVALSANGVREACEGAHCRNAVINRSTSPILFNQIFVGFPWFCFLLLRSSSYCPSRNLSASELHLSLRLLNILKHDQAARFTVDENVVQDVMVYCYTRRVVH